MWGYKNIDKVNKVFLHLDLNGICKDFESLSVFGGLQTGYFKHKMVQRNVLINLFDWFIGREKTKKLGRWFYYTTKLVLYSVSSTQKLRWKILPDANLSSLEYNVFISLENS